MIFKGATMKCPQPQSSAGHQNQGAVFSSWLAWGCRGQPCSAPAGVLRRLRVRLCPSLDSPAPLASHKRKLFGHFLFIRFFSITDNLVTTRGVADGSTKLSSSSSSPTTSAPASFVSVLTNYCHVASSQQQLLRRCCAVRWRFQLYHARSPQRAHRHRKFVDARAVHLVFHVVPDALVAVRICVGARAVPLLSANALVLVAVRLLPCFSMLLSF